MRAGVEAPRGTPARRGAIEEARGPAGARCEGEAVGGALREARGEEPEVGQRRRWKIGSKR